MPQSKLQVKAGSLQAWLSAVRPATLPLACAPVFVGSAIAWKSGCFSEPAALAALLGAVLLQVLANLANDLFDFAKGADNEQRLGPPRAAQLGLLTLKQLRVALLVLVICLLALGSYLVWRSGIAILALGLAAIASAIAYTAGPLPLAYNGFGDLFVWIFFGYAATCGTVFVQCTQVPPMAWIAGTALGALSNAVLVVNHVRDEVQDRASQKYTWVVLLGRKFGLFQYTALFALAFVVPLILAARQYTSWWILLPFLLLPYAAVLIGRLTHESGFALNAVLVRTAVFSVAYAVLFCIGIVC